MDNRPKFARAPGQRESAGQPLPGFVPMLVGVATLSGLLFLLFRFLRRQGLPFGDVFSWITRTAINPLLGVLPEPVQRLLMSSLSTQAEQAAFGAWLCVLAIAAVLLPLAPSPKAYRRRMGLEALIRAHARRTPRVRPVLHCDPREDDRVGGPWSPPPTHEEWARSHGLDTAGEFPRETLEKLLRNQLVLANPAGKRRAVLCARAAQAVCIERILHGRAAGNALIDELATSFDYCTLKHYRLLQKGAPVSLFRLRVWQFLPFARHSGRPWYRPGSWVRMPLGAYRDLPCERIIHRAWLMARREGADLLAEARRRHAFISTRCVWLLAQARERSGVLEPSALLWLRPVCRVLWCSLHQLGLNCANVESAAVAAHYAAEEEAGKALPDLVSDALLWGMRQALWPDEETQV